MRRIARLVTICLLLMAIPVKGAVAASMVMCGPGHERATAPITAETEKIAGGNVSSHQHNHASYHYAGNGGSAFSHGAGIAQHETLATHGAVKCSICAACCVGGAFLVSTEVSVPASVGTEAPLPTLEVQFSGTVLAGLERPPRTFLV